MPTGQPSGRYDTTARTSWPSAWKQPARERMTVIELSCGCLRAYPAPVPVVGASLSCLTHKASVRVVG